MSTSDQEKNTDARRQRTSNTLRRRTTVTLRRRTTDTLRSRTTNTHHHKTTDTRHHRATVKEEAEAIGITPAKVDKAMEIRIETTAAAKGVLAPGRAQNLTLINAILSLPIQDNAN